MLVKMILRIRRYRPHLVLMSVFVLYLIISSDDAKVLVSPPFRPMITEIQVPLQSSPIPLHVSTTARPKIWILPKHNPAYFKPRKSVVNPMKFNILISANQDCAETPPFLTVLVLSMHSNRNYRDAIRETWGSISTNGSWPHTNIKERVKVVFLLGSVKNSTLNQMVEEESKITRDIIMYDFMDTYFNLTCKVLMGFKWLKDFCPQSKFVLKCDEDTFVNMPLVVERLRSKEWNTKISGPYYTTSRAMRSGRYKVMKSAFPFDLYPPHVKGNIYFMPTTIAMKLLNVSYYMPYVNMEDAHITGILAKAVGGIYFKGLYYDDYAPFGVYCGCSFIYPPRVASQMVTPDCARATWDNMKNKTKCTT